jgi:hypothetical protein
MTKISILFEDKTVSVDGVSYPNIDLNSAPNGYHAFQWKDNIGWFEFSENIDGTKPENQKITELPNWIQSVLDSWQIANIDFQNQKNEFNQMLEERKTLALQMEKDFTEQVAISGYSGTSGISGT